MVKTERKQLSKKLRFEIFKRDSFKCQYCGKSAPDVILHVDHLNPVAKGGDNDILNLVTSCFDCNSGKSDRLLTDNSILSVQKKQLDDLNERREQLNMLIEWRTILEDKSFEIDKILEYINLKNNSNISLSQTGIKNIKTLLKKRSHSEILDGIDSAYEKFGGEEGGIEKQLSMLSKMIDFNLSSDDDRNKMKFFGAIKKRFEDTSGYNYYNTANINEKLRFIFSLIDKKEVSFDYSYLFKLLNSNNTYSRFMGDINELFQNIS